jgi:hypothetical protein
MAIRLRHVVSGMLPLELRPLVPRCISSGCLPRGRRRQPC